jgi:hypothetical protein
MVALPRRTAMLPRESDVSMAKVIIMENQCLLKSLLLQTEYVARIESEGKGGSQLRMPGIAEFEKAEP